MNKFFCIVVCCCLCSCFQAKDEKIEKIQAEVIVVRPQKKSYENAFETFGTVSYKKKNNVAAVVSGYLDELYVKEGDFVEKGDVLGKLKNVQLEIQIEQSKMDCDIAKNNYEQALLKKRDLLQTIEAQFISFEKDKIQLQQKNKELQYLRENLRKQRELLNIGGITEESFKECVFTVEKLENEVKVFEKEIEITYVGFRDEDLLASGIIPSKDEKIKKQQVVSIQCANIDNEIKKCQIENENALKNFELSMSLQKEMIFYAPISGIVVTKHFEKGEFIQEKEQLFTIIPSNELAVVVSIQEKDRDKINCDTKLYVMIDSFRLEFETKIVEIAPIVDANTSTFFIKASIDENLITNNGIVPGMFVQCKIIVGEKKDFFAIPEKCLINKTGEEVSFFVVRNNVLLKKQVQDFYVKDGFIYIEKGLSGDEQVVANPQIYFWEGQYVEVL